MFDWSAYQDFEAGMATLFAGEAGLKNVLKEMRVHDEHGYSLEFLMERFDGGTPLLVIDEGTSKIQRLIIIRHPNERNPTRERA